METDLLIEALKKSGHWDMSRPELLRKMRRENIFYYPQQYFVQLEDLLGRILESSRSLNIWGTHHYECLIYSQALRVRRYVLAFSNLIVKKGDVLIACMDGAYPIYKALFELMIEIKMARAYLNEFGYTPEKRQEVTQRVLIYTDLSKKRTNFKHKFRSNIMPEVLPQNKKSRPLK